ncbi:hypothetical protein Pla22_32040 [Rubripirellula amarantea]|uniref:Tandem-95 repeat protein n=1 Tax=Rubripirellula amarantea TaxID=2527999 RepID=A0A5C5WKC1_9BACT|nr:Ig-like domain-containing protein [Rubripirellula amarantea]TWT50461.1 hypothetical protein Pla22_32040 [Rubripirellula amarantea]
MSIVSALRNSCSKRDFCSVSKSLVPIKPIKRIKRLMIIEMLESRELLTAATGDHRFFGAIANPGQTDTFEFSLAAPQQLWFDTLTNDANISWSMEGGQGAVASYAFSNDDQVFGTQPAGDYTVTVSGNADYTGSYAFCVLEMSTLATSIAVDTTINGVVDPTITANLYSFAGTAGTSVYVESLSNTTTDLNGYTASWYVYDHYGTQLASNYYFANDLGRIDLPITGTYTIAIQGNINATGGTETYALKVYSVADTTTAFTLGTAVAGNTTAPGQANEYTFTLASPTSLYFDSQTNDGSLHWSLKGPQGNVVSPTSFNYDDNVIGLMPAGTYTLTVNRNDATTGGYAFNLIDLANATAITTGSVGTPAGPTVTGTLSPAESAKAYKFTGIAGNRLLFNNINTSGDSAHWILLDPYNNVVFDDYTSTDQSNVVISASGTYTLVMAGYLGNTVAPSFDFQINYQSNTTPPTIPGTVITLGTVKNGTIPAGGISFYKFTLASPTQLYFDARTDNTSLGWTLIGPQGTVINSYPLGAYYENTGDVFIGLMPAGTYALQIAGPASTAFSFNMLDVGVATSVTLDTPVSSSVSARATKLYRFAGTAGTAVYVDVTTSSNNLEWRLYDPFGNVVPIEGPATSVGRFELLATGDYTLAAVSDLYATGSSNFTFNVENVVDTTTALTLGVPVTGTISVPSQVKDYSFTLTQPTRLWFDIQSVDSFENYWQLIGPLGNVVAGTWFAYDDTDIGLQPAGDYTLQLTRSYNTTGSFSFNLLDVATASSLTIGTQQNDTLVGPVTKLYKFTGTAGTSLYVDSVSDSTNDPNGYAASWCLYDPYGTQLVTNAFIYDLGRFDLETSGPYTLAVIGHLNSIGTESIAFKVSSTADTTTALTLGTPVTGNIATPGQIDKYTFTLGAPAQLWFDSQSGTAYQTNWQLVGPQGNVVSSTYFNYDDHIIGLIPAGDYTLEVNESGGATGTYAFNLLDYAAAMNLTLGTPVSDTLVGPATKLYQFAGTAGTSVFGNSISDTTDDPNGYTAGWKVYDQYGTLVGQASYLANDIGRIDLPTTGTYTVVIQGNYNSTGTETFTFNVSSITDSTTPLTLGSAATGNTAMPGQVNKYTFTLGAPTSLYFDVQTYDTSLYWSLTGPQGQVVNQTWFYYDDQVIGLVPAGNYTLTLERSDDSTGNYAFNMLDFANATAITTGTSGTPAGPTVSGSLNPAESAKAYKFTGVAGNRLLFNNITNSGNPANWILLDPYNNVVFNDSIANDQSTVIMTASGTYTLVMTGQLGNTISPAFSFQINYESNVTPPAIPGTTITLGTARTGTIPAGLTSFFKFTVASPTRLFFDSRTADNNLTWNLIGPQGTVVNSYYFGPYNESTGDLSIGLMPAGTYALQVSGPSGTPFAFNMLDVGAATSVTLGATTSSSVAVRTAKLYKFGGTEGDNVYLSSTTNSTTTEWALFDPYGNQLSNATMPNALGRFELPSTGDYTVAIQSNGYATSTANFAFKVQPVTDQTSPLTLGTPVTGSITEPAQVSRYTFTLSTPKQLWFDSRTDDASQIVWSLKGPQGTVVAVNYFSYDDQVIGLMPAGDYVLEVSRPDDSLGAFAFNLLDHAAATNLTLGLPVTDSIVGPVTKLYQFAGTAGTSVFVDSISDTTNDPNGYTASWIVVDKFGAVVASNSYLSNDLSRINMNSTGMYTLVVQGSLFSTGTESFSFNVRSVSDDDRQLWGTPGSDSMVVEYLGATTRDVYLNGYLAGTLYGVEPLTLDGKADTDSLSVIGTSAADAFAITPTEVNLGSVSNLVADIESRSVNGGSGADTFSYSGSNPDLTLLGGAGLDTFSPGNAATVYSIDGGANGATINYSASTVGVVVDLAGSILTGVTQFSNVTGVVGSPQSDAPIGASFGKTALEDTAYTFTVADFAFTDPGDVPAHALQAVKIATLPAAGVLTNNSVAAVAGDSVSAADIVAGNFKFTSAINASGPTYASFTFRIQDNGGTASGGLDLDPTARTVSIAVAPVNDPPVQTAGTVSPLSVLEDSPITTFGLTGLTFGAGGGSDESTQTLTYKVTEIPASIGGVYLSDNTTAVVLNSTYSISQIQGMKFLPLSNANGADNFVVSVADNGGTTNGGVDTLLVTIPVTVTSVNDAPMGVATSVLLPEDTSYTFSLSDFTFAEASDNPANALLAVKLTTIPAVGSITNDNVPVVAGNNVSVSDIVSGKLKFTPVPNANGTSYAGFTFQVQDDGGTANGGIDLDSTPKAFSLNVTSVNDAPLGTSNVINLSATGVYTFVANDFGFSDPNDSPADSFLAVKITTLPSSGALTNNDVAVTPGTSVLVSDIATGKFKFTSIGSSSATFMFQVQDDGGVTNGGADTDSNAKSISLVSAFVAVNDSEFAGTALPAYVSVLDNDIPSGVLQVIGATNAANGSVTVVGSDVVYTSNPGFTGTDSFDYTMALQDAELVSSAASSGDRFGYSVDVDGDYAVVGAYLDDPSGRTNAGSVFIYRRTGPTTWTQVKLLNGDLNVDDAQSYFGWSVAISGDTVVVGAQADRDNGFKAGAVYVFDRNEGGADNWGRVAKIYGSDTDKNDYFGRSIDISGDTIVVGASICGSLGAAAGAAYVFQRNQGGTNAWGQTKKLVGSTQAAGDRFGQSVSIDNNTIVVGAFQNDVVANNAGAVFVFDRDTGGANNWGEQKAVYAVDASAVDYFGYSVAVSNGVIAIGTPLDDEPGKNQTGSVYVISQNQGGTNNWGQTARLLTANPVAGDRLGWSVAIDGNRIVSGAIQADIGGDRSGSAYLFENVASTWSQTRVLVNDKVTTADEYGVSIALDGDMAIVGSWLDNRPVNNSGGAYAFDLRTDTATVTVDVSSPPSEVPSVVSSNLAGGESDDLVMSVLSDAQASPVATNQPLRHQAMKPLEAEQVDFLFTSDAIDTREENVVLLSAVALGLEFFW